MENDYAIFLLIVGNPRSAREARPTVVSDDMITSVNCKFEEGL